MPLHIMLLVVITLIVVILIHLATAMHCNLRPPDVAPVVLSFNYEDLHQPTKCNNSTTSIDRPIMHMHRI